MYVSIVLWKYSPFRALQWWYTCVWCQFYPKGHCNLSKLNIWTRIMWPISYIMNAWHIPQMTIQNTHIYVFKLLIVCILPGKKEILHENMKIACTENITISVLSKVSINSDGRCDFIDTPSEILDVPRWPEQYLHVIRFMNDWLFIATCQSTSSNYCNRVILCNTYICMF